MAHILLVIGKLTSYLIKLQKGTPSPIGGYSFDRISGNDKYVGREVLNVNILI